MLGVRPERGGKKKKKEKKGEFLLEKLRKIPIVQVACEKVGVSRNTVYRWRKEDPEFAKTMDEALADGEAVINDMSESQLLSKIKNGEWPPIAFWLRKRHPKFKDRLEVVSTIAAQEELTDEEEAVVRVALRLGSVSIKPPPSEEDKKT